MMDKAQAQLLLEISSLLKAKEALHGLSDAERRMVGEFRKFSDEFEKGKHKMVQASNETSKGIAGIQKNLNFLTNLTGISLGFTAIKGAIRGTIGAYNEQAQAEGKLANILKTTGGAIGQTKDQLVSYAGSLQSATLFTDDAIIELQGLLATFKNIDPSLFNRATEAALDMSTVFGQDLHASAIQLGKALENPIAGIAALSRTGVTFSDSQKAMIQSLVESGQKAEAQKLILKELETQVKGAARAAAIDGTGGFNKLADAAGETGEAIGSGVVGAIKFFLPAITEITEAVTDFLGVTKSSQDMVDEGILSFNAQFEVLKQLNAEIESSSENEELNNLQKQERNRLINEINTQYGQYLPNLITEKTSLEEINKLQQSGLEVLTATLVLKAHEMDLQEAMDKGIEKTRELTKAREELASGDFFGSAEDFNARVIFPLIGAQEGYAKEIQRIHQEISKDQIELQKTLKQNKIPDRPKKTESIAPEVDMDAVKKAIDERIKAEQEAQKQLRKLREENELAAIHDALNKQLLKLEQEQAHEEEAVQASLATEETKQKLLLEIFEKYARMRQEATAKSMAEVQRIEEAVTKQTAKEMQEQLADTNQAVADALNLVLANTEEQVTKRLPVSFDEAITKINDKLKELRVNEFLGAGIQAFTTFSEIAAQRQTELIDAQIADQQRLVDNQLANIAFLEEAEANASGQRKERIQQSIAIEKARVEEEKKRTLELENQKKQIAIKAAQRAKAISIFNTTISTAQAIIGALADITTPLPLRIASSIAAGIIGAAQIAAISAQPLPQFRKGGRVKSHIMKGPRHEQGGILINTEGEEHIFSREHTRKFSPLFDAIQHNRISPALANSLVMRPMPMLHASSNAGMSDALRNEIRELRSELGNLKQVSVNYDERGVRVAEERGRTRTEYMNKRYRA